MMTLLKRVAKQTAFLFEKTPSVQEIHDDFEMASQRAVEEAKKIIAKIDIESSKERVATLKRLGFVNMPEVKELTAKQAEYNKSKKILDTALQYELKYPQYKFITLDMVVTICKKYALCCAPVGRYKGGIPDKNLKEIAAFDVKDEDTYFELSSSHDRNHNDITAPHRFRSFLNMSSYDRNHHDPVTKFICAPHDHFEFTKDDKPFGEVFVTRFIKDPIVLHFVRDGFLIVSKWGAESNDPELVNQKMN